MATAEIVASDTTGPPPAIRHPLERLTGTIRRYVLLEGLAIVGILALLVLIVSGVSFAIDARRNRGQRPRRPRAR